MSDRIFVHSAPRRSRQVLPLLFLLAIFAGCSPCANEIQSQSKSPDGRLNAILLYRDCGATTGSSTQVSILPVSHALANECWNSFVANHRVRVEIVWEANDQVLIKDAR